MRDDDKMPAETIKGELDALREIVQVLEPFTSDQQSRILQFAIDLFALNFNRDE